MNYRQTRTVFQGKAFVKVLDRNAPLPPIIQPLAATLKERVSAIEAAGLEQTVAKQAMVDGSRNGKRFRRDLRRKQMIPIARGAKVHFAHDGTVLAALRVPHANADVDALVAAAKRMIDALRPFERDLVTQGFAPGFLDRLAADAEELKQLDARARDGQRRRSLATRALGEHFRELRGVVQAIEAHVVALADRYPELAAAWQSQRPIGKRLGRPTPRKVAARKKRASD